MSQVPNEQTEHARLDRAIVAATKLLTGDAGAMLPAFVELENMLRLHFSREETGVLPRYRVHDREHATIIETQHDEMRGELRACRLALEAGRLERERIQSLFNRYRIHQLHEDTSMYRWAREQG